MQIFFSQAVDIVSITILAHLQPTHTRTCILVPALENRQRIHNNMELVYNFKENIFRSGKLFQFESKTIPINPQDGEIFGAAKVGVGIGLDY